MLYSLSGAHILLITLRPLTTVISHPSLTRTTLTSINTSSHPSTSYSRRGCKAVCTCSRAWLAIGPMLDICE